MPDRKRTPRIAVLVPCYKRPEYTNLCLDSIVQAQKYKNVKFILVDDGSGDETLELLQRYAKQLRNSKSKCDVFIKQNKKNKGLRNTIIDFFELVLDGDGKDLTKTKVGGCIEKVDYIAKVDNDCAVPLNWLDDLLELIQSVNADIISPNVSESNAAHKFGKLNKRVGDFIPSEIVGGLWFMKTDMIRDIYFESFNSSGIRAAFNIIHQIVSEKTPKIGWSESIIVEDIGHWGGTHPNHLKSLNHAQYSAEVGRPIAWSPED